MPAITRRTLLALTGAGVAFNPVSAAGKTSPKLQVLIATHQAAYEALHHVFRRAANGREDRERADTAEQEALLAICSYPAIGRHERRAKAEYLLAVEARGELDLEEHMQAILRSMRRG
ncbi:hypothetical protein [Mesorhizobium salmacidum]|uniref:Uncharacterized protein n=1 Tax=Mesorhizobium salmacidum TaxID=3015171 RepID=A0ABU8KUC6_9HYPH